MDRNWTTPSSVTFWCVLSYSTQNGSASGCGKSVPIPSCWSVQVNGLVPSQPEGPAASDCVAGSSASAADNATTQRHMGRGYAVPRPFPPPLQDSLPQSLALTSGGSLNWRSSV